MAKPILLSPPDVGASERALLLEAFDSNWIAPLGPHVDAFEAEMAEHLGVRYAIALSSGTAALHLALLALGVGADDEVWLSTLTFIAPASAVCYVGALPVFIDSEWSSWNLDPDLLLQALHERSLSGRLPAAVIAVDIYGQCADYGRLREACRAYGIPIIEDAAEALGATCDGKPAGSFGDVSILSFNGNKIITTGGGGMLLTDRPEVAARGRHLATQAREPVLHYEHLEVGYNYRLSNLLAAVGRAQLTSLAAKVARRREIFASYDRALGALSGVAFMPEPGYSYSSRWLSVALVDASITGVSRDMIVSALADQEIESRPAWKPMHQQLAFRGCTRLAGGVADTIFATGLCLPSGSNLSDDDVRRVIDVTASLLEEGQTRL